MKNSILKLQAGILIMICLIIPSFGFSQQKEVEKWQAILDSVETDSLKFNALIRLFGLNSRSNLDMALRYLDRADSIAMGQESPFYSGTVAYQRAAYFNFKGKNDSTFVYATKACEILKNTPFRRAYALSLGNLSTSLGSQNARKIGILKQVESIYQELNDSINLIWTWNSIAYNYINLNEFDSALFYVNQSLGFCRSLNDIQRTGATLVRKCDIFFSQHRFDEAIKTGYEALEYCRKSNNKNDEIWIYITLANIFYHQNSYEKSHEYYQKALDLSLSSGLGNRIPRIYLERGNVYLLQKNIPEAQKYFGKAMETAKANKNEYQEMAAHSGHADLYYQINDYHQSLFHATAGLSIAQRINAKTDLPYFNFLSGLNYYQLGNLDSALYHTEQSYSKASDIKDHKKLMENAELLSKIYESMNVYDKALIYFREYKGYQDSIYNAEKSRIIVEAENKYENARKQEQIQKLTAEKEISRLILEKKEQQLLMEVARARNQAGELELAEKASMIKDLELSEVRLKRENQDKQLLLQQSELEMTRRNLVTANLIAGKEKSLRNMSILAVVVTVVAACLILFFFVRKKQNEKRLSLMEERLRISRELHDDLGSTLSSISVYSDVAKNRALRNAGNEEVLNKISFASRDLIDKMSDIVWSLNPGNETVDQLKNRMIAFAAMILSPNGILSRFDFDDELLNLNLPPEKRKNLFLIFKEAIHNVVKHANAKNVLVTFKREGHGLVMEISDDGSGFPPLKNGNGLGGNGLNNLKSRARDIGGEFSIENNENAGATVKIMFT